MSAAARRLRVAHVVPAPDFVSLILRNDLERLADRVDSVVFCSPGRPVGALRDAGLAVHEVPIERKITPLHDLRSLWALARHLRRGSFDIVVGYTPKGGLLAALAGAAAGIRWRIHSCRGLLYVPGQPWHRRMLFRLVDRVTNMLSVRTLFVSRGDMQFSVDQGLCSSAQARYIGNGIDMRYYDPAVVDRGAVAAVRRSLDIPDHAPLLLTVGRFVRDKGYEELAIAAGRILERIPEARFLWIAPALTGEAGVLSPAIVQQHGLGAAVTILGEQSDLRPYYLAANLLVHPSHREGTPRVLMEAAAMGLPIVASDIRGCREVITHGETGLLFPPHEPAAITDSVITALGNRAALGDRAGQARRHVRAAFDADCLAGRIWQVYDELVPHHHINA